MKLISKFNYPTIGVVLLVVLFFTRCQDIEQVPTPGYEIASKWADLALYVTQYTPLNTPTYASRCFGYIGLTMYESVVHGFDSHNSLKGQLIGFDSLPVPANDEDIDWILSMNAAQAQIIRLVYNQTSDENKAKIDSLENAILDSRLSMVSDDIIVDRSVAFGKSVAQSIFNWSLTDGGHRAYLRNFDKDWVHPEHPGSWEPPLYSQSISHHPLHPYWGENRRFAPGNDTIAIPYMIPYDTTPGSEYYKQFMAVYEMDKRLTQEDKEIAIWWGDDPDVTFTPPGHSYYIASIAVRKNQPNLVEAAETYARVGIAVADAFINCWKWKYHFFSERPNTYIPRFIDQEWESFWPDPPFPAFPSGHAIQAATAATVLEDLYGKEFIFTDSAHVGRERDELRDVDFRQRSFTTFWGAAQETADSRFYGGIHVPQDNNVGLREGKKIAENVNNLQWRKN
ncbi:MAG: vanadium-dependent haloperoxidase [Cyclobacteriaceae bacterium]|nr:vanadium-dependent haloperoxidase [Cyclobacteriaceae bacterium SS2]